MEISRNWLADFAPIPDDVELLVSTLTSLGIAVEDVSHVGGVPGVVTARVSAHRTASRRRQGDPRLGRQGRRR